MNEPILITGCARSGTSLVAGIINMRGAFGGVMSGPNSSNAKGMFENVRIRNDVVKPYFQSLGVDKMGQYPLPDIDSLPIPYNWRKRVENIMISEGYEGGPWMYKGAKMCLHWPVWHYAFPNAKWIIVRRKPTDIIRSCMRTGFMTAFNNKPNQIRVGANSAEEGWAWWIEQHKKRFIEMIEEGLNVKQIWPERMVQGDYTQINEMLNWLGLEWGPEITEFIEPKLWKAREMNKQK
jgi:hypothetical protein